MTQSRPSMLLLSRRVGEWIYGGDPVQRGYIERLFRSVTLYLVGNLLLWLGVLAGVTPAWSTCVVTAYGGTGSLLCYASLRSGLARHWRDPSLAYQILLFSASSVALSYTLIQEARGAALQLLCLLLAFEMDRLSWRRLLVVSLCTVGALAAISFVQWLLEPGAVQVSVEVYNLLMAAVLLPVAIIVAAEVRRLYNRQLQQREELAHTLTQLNDLSTHDDLTGLLNRRQMLILLEQEEKRQRLVDQPFCVAILDIDWFKRVNDTHGHAVGDVVLQVFSRLAGIALARADTLARWGGEEFLLLMPASNEAQTMNILSRVREIVGGYDWNVHAPGLQVSFSAGVALHVRSESVAQTIERADRALYDAKEGGRDRVVAASMADELGAVSEHTAQPLGADQSLVAPRMASMIGLDTPAADRRNVPMPSAFADHVAAAPGPGVVVPSGPWRWLGNLVLSDRADIRENLRMPMLAIGLYAIWIAMFYWYAMPSGQMDATLGLWLIRYDTVAMLAFYPLIRSGWSTRSRDGPLVLPQVLVACGACVIAYVSAPVLRPSVLHLMCVIQVFAMVSLYPRGSRVAGIGAVLMLLLMLGIMVWVAPRHLQFNAKLDALKVLLTCFIVGRLSMLSYDYSQVREKVATEQRQLVQAIAQVQELVIRDSLTGLFNRKHLRALLEQEHERSERTGCQFCVAIIDLDHFKRVNDTYGHQAGDEVLQGFAKAAQAVLRETDVIGRWGGEEFLVLMPNANPAVQGLRALERLRQRLAGTCPAPSAPNLTVTFSCGVTLVGLGEPIEPVLERADRALYAAKAAGRDRCVIADGLPASNLAPNLLTTRCQP